MTGIHNPNGLTFQDFIDKAEAEEAAGNIERGQHWRKLAEALEEGAEEARKR